MCYVVYMVGGNRFWKRCLANCQQVGLSGGTQAYVGLYVLKQLRCTGVPQAQFLYFYTGVIRPVLEYAAPD